MAEPGLDVRSIRFYAIASAMTTWIPMPVLDEFVEGQVRRAMIREVFRREGVPPNEESVSILADRPWRSCLGCMAAVMFWPIKKLLKWFFLFLEVKEMADIGSDVAHRAILVQDAILSGWLPGDARRVREAMDRTFQCVESRPLERYLRGPFRIDDSAFREAVRSAVELSRSPASPPSHETTASMHLALTTRGLVPEVVHAFRAEMQRTADIPVQSRGSVN